MRAVGKAFERRLQLVRILIRRGSIQTSQAALFLGCDRRTALSDMKALSENGVPLHVEGTDKDRKWVLDESWRELGLQVSLGDRLALMFGRDLVDSFLHDTDLSEHLDALDRHLEALDPESARGGRDAAFRRRFYCVHEPPKDYAAHRDTIDTLVKALLGTYRVSFTYQPARGGGPSRYERIAPLTLAVYKRGLYLLFRKRSRGRRKDGAAVERSYQLAVERMTDIDAHPDLAFDYPWASEYDPATELSGRFGIALDTRHPVSTVRVRFGPEVHTYVASREWMPGQRITPLPDGGCELTFEATGPELVSTVLSFGPQAEVLSPPWLREAVAQQLRQAARAYE